VSASAIQIPPDARAAHRGLSPAAERFLEHLLENPDDARRLERMDEVLPKWWFTYDFTPLTWPTFVDAGKLEKLRRATEGVCRLIKAIPAVIFHGDFKAIARFYGYRDPGYLQMLFRAPNPLGTTLARCDFIDTAQGLKCCEVNLAANIGGWQHRFWEETYMTHPVVTGFAAREGVVPRWRDPLRIACEHLVEDAMASGVVDGGELNVMVKSLPFTERAASYAQELYARLLRETGSGLTGELWLTQTPEEELSFRDGVPYRGDRRVHAFIEYAGWAPPSVARAQVAATVRLYNGGLMRFMVNKRNLALLSENEELELWTDEDRALIRDHVPWTRLVSARTTTYRGETVTFPGFLVDRRDDLVLKLGEGVGGADVHVGRCTEPAEWEARVREAVEHGGWIVQEYVESLPYLYPPEPGAAPVPQSVIWGLFYAGWRYAGAWLRMMPAGKGDGIVNSGRGAAEGAVIELE
jgi:hypothetical protein